ncbi:MAG: (2Fe-2S)-binding protein [Rhizobiaceae bacterium]|nr:(2Fe-2S)-binding protein [Rhizobiaceae bacterium]MBO6727230.1 (2Fe-2S)-binding protein [Rhizobiaceae bacterium]
MLICHCNMITEKEIEQTIRSLLAADPWGLIVPAKVYHALQQRGRCCGCFPNVVEIIIRVTEEFHQELGEQKAESVTFLDRVRGLRSHREENNEGRQKGHRAA